ncbi:MAG TPA: class I fructose-bisphosphate aldolase [Streptosporangiaceae bacterium]
MRLLAMTASALVAPGKGMLAADESIATMSARLTAAGVAPTQENRRAYREMLITTPGLANGISGVILSDETFRQHLRAGQAFPVALRELGLMPGIKVDTGARPLAGRQGETVTEGLDGLPPRLRQYAELGAQFAKWRAVLRIGPGTPSGVAVRANAQALARYAAACQDAGLVPIVEPEVLMDGPHTLGHCETVTSMVLLEVMSELHEYGVDFESVVLKPNMALPGTESGEQPGPAEVAEATLGTLNGVPISLAGVAFLSGGQRPERATEHLAAMQHVPHLWPLTFSFGRALVGPALAAWRGEPGRWRAGQRALAWRVAMNAAALAGRYRPELAPDLDPA